MSSSKLLLSFAQAEAANAVSAGPGVTLRPSTTVDGAALHLEVAAQVEEAHLSIPAPAGVWDVSPYRYVAVELLNSGSQETMVALAVRSKGADEWDNRNDVTTVLQPGERKIVKVLIVRLPLQENDPLGRYFAGPTGTIGGEYGSGMLGLPGGYTWHWNRIDPAQVTTVEVSLPYPKGGESLEIFCLTAEGEYNPPTGEQLAQDFSPFIDAFGQYRYQDWPGKIHTPVDLVSACAREDEELAAHPGPSQWNQFGGWLEGPQLDATGRFYPIKHEGKWWLVDPEGRLFWSHGLDCVNLEGSTTRIKDREHYFQELPGDDSPLLECYQFQEGERYSFNFATANLIRKYGPDWHDISSERVHTRLRSWGLNTIGNWSDPSIFLQRKTPYTVDIHYDSRGLEGNWKLPDPFDPEFVPALRDSLAARAESIGDPWCLGYFVDNELNWQDDLAAGLQVVQSPPEQPAKQALLEDLTAKYVTINALNKYWGTAYGSWKELLACRTAPDATRAARDLTAFIERFNDTYFRLCREAVIAHDPAALYLGCRMHHIYPKVALAAARYCDVFSINCYRYDVRAMVLPEELQLPVVIGEWHFGALDRGLLHPSLRHVQDQSERAVMYRSYLKGALAHPSFVGAHWFQYVDQATTGRFDGENYQAGFVDICDTPYWETIQACREVGSHLYPLRYGQ